MLFFDEIRKVRVEGTDFTLSGAKETYMKNLRPFFLLAVSAFLFFQCSEEEIKPTNSLIEEEISAQAQRTDALVIGALVNADYDDAISGYDYEFYLTGDNVNITINWGDGTTTQHAAASRYDYDGIFHGYKSPGRYIITITGTLDKVVEFSSYYGHADFNAINFAALPNLEIVNVGLTRSPATMDLTKNPSLTTVSLAGMPDMKNLVLPRTHNISQLSLDGPFQLDTEDVDKIVSNIHKNTIAKNIQGGLITLRASWAQDENDYSMIGPPSGFTLDKLRFLRDSYGWSIYPSPDANPV